jgi:hypothetical protein
MQGQPHVKWGYYVRRFRKKYMETEPNVETTRQPWTIFPTFRWTNINDFQKAMLKTNPTVSISHWQQHH